MTSGETRTLGRVNVLDAWLWILIPGILLMLVHIGVVSGDGLSQSEKYAHGTWFWNPNHLFYEPLGAWWQTTLRRIGISRSGPDLLKLLSIVAGSISLGLFRWGVAGPLARHRTDANLATVWVALGATYAGLWLSDETQIVQMPFLMLMAIAVVRYVAAPRTRTAVLIGFAAGMAALFYISDILFAITIAGTLAVWHLRQRDVNSAVRTVVCIAIGSAIIAGVGFVSAWYFVAPPHEGILAWLTTYGGGQVHERVAASYGVHSIRELVTSTARAVYGTANTIVDLSGVITAVRDHSVVGLKALSNIIVFLVAVAVLLAALVRAIRYRGQYRYNAVLILVIAWTIAVVGFGIYWNNSDDQFYFQLAVPIGALIATVSFLPLRTHWLWLVGSLVFIVWNGSEAFLARITYPRTQYVNAIASATAGATLVVTPGQDEVGQMLYFVHPPTGTQRIELTTIATRYPSTAGLDTLRHRIQDVLASRGRVDVIAVFDVSDQQNPWKYLRDLGYEQSAIRAVLTQFPHECTSRMAGPFSVRSIAPGLPCATIPSTNH